MRAGELDRRITIETPTDVRDAEAAISQTWAAFVPVGGAALVDIPAKVIPRRGTERFAAAQINVEFDTTFRIRYVAGITAKMRIQYDGVTYDIQYPAELGRREGLDLLAKVFQG